MASMGQSQDYGESSNSSRRSGHERAAAAERFQIFDRLQSIECVPEIAAVVGRDPGTSCDGVLKVPAISAVHEGEAILRHARDD